MRPILILAFNRPNELKRCIESAKEVFGEQKIYMYVDKPYSEKTREEQKGVIELAKKHKVVLKKAQENQGTQIAMKQALLWVSSLENEFIVLEEDILVTQETKAYLQEKESVIGTGIVRFGMFYWGYATNKNSVHELLALDYGKLDERNWEAIKNKRIFKHKNHFLMTIELYKRNAAYPWDDEFNYSTKILGIEVAEPQMPTTVHVGQNSARIERAKELSLPSEIKKVKMINGKFV